MKRTYIDVTDLIDYARLHSTLSGIQRVSVMTIARIRAAHGAEACRLIAHHPTKKRVMVFPSDLFDDFVYDQARILAAFDVAAPARAGAFGRRDLEGYLSAKYGRGGKARLHRLRLKAANWLTRGQTFRRRGVVGPAGASGAALAPLPFEVAAPAPGDTIFVPGAIWNFTAYLDYLAEVEGRGVEIVQFVHDLIPLVTPEHIDDGAPERFSSWLLRMSSIASRFIVNSRATRADLELFLAAHAPMAKRVDVVPLAHEFVVEAPRAAGEGALFLNPRHRSAVRLSAQVYNAARLPYALCVGTIESRKNVWTLARVWDSLAAELGERMPRLVFAGKPGCLNQDFTGLMRASGGLGGLVRFALRPSDAELAYLYAHCQFSAFVSYYEGWGLPIGESLWFGRPVVASSASAMPEVGGDLVDYADPYDFQAIRAAIRRLVVDDDYREARAAQIRAARLRTWRETADDLWAALADAPSPAPERGRAENAPAAVY